MRTEQRKLVPTAAFVCCILYITIFSRTPSLAHIVKPIPFWSYIDWIKGNWERGRSILLNIVLFIPLGFLLGDFKKAKSGPFYFCIILTGTIELAQFLTYRGLFDIDDIISNFIGGSVGVFCYRHLNSQLKSFPFSYLIVIIGVIGCILESGSSQIYESQFDFQIKSVEIHNNTITLSGICDIYHRGFLPYQIQLTDEDKVIQSTTEIEDTTFIATADAPSAEYEVDVVFKGYQPISTGTYLNGDQVEYVPNSPEPDVDSTDLENVIENGVLKIYNEEYDVFVYQVKDRLYWIIGTDFDASIIYHLYTDDKEKLPEKRIKNGFDNRGFRIGSEKDITESMNCRGYRVFSDIIPTEYYVTAIAVGMNRGPDVLWRQFFRPNRF